MGQLKQLDELPLGVRRALPFVAAVVLGLLAWQMPVFAEFGDEPGDEVETASSFETPTSTTSTTEVDAAAPSTTAFAPPTTLGAASAPVFRPATPVGSALTTTAAPAATTTTTTTTAAPAATTTTAPNGPARITGQLRITKSTWGQNTLQRGTPAEDVPDGVLPVEIASYIPSRQSYIEVRGTTATITLQLADEESPPDASEPVVIACEITTRFWTDSSPGSSFEESPPYDPESCVDGTVNDDGSWTFDLSGFGDLNEHPGFALVPVSDGTLGTYSVWYADLGAS